MFDLEKFSSRLKEGRIRAGLTKVKLSKMVDCTHSSITHYEKSQFVPVLRVAVNIANALGVSMDWLCGEGEDTLPALEKINAEFDTDGLDGLLELPIDILDLSTRPYNRLRSIGVDTVGALANTPIEKLRKTRQLGEKSLVEIVEKMRIQGMDNF
jgi:DNA-directed RNA polymerase alpha subunit